MGQLVGKNSPFDGHPCTRRGDRIAVKYQTPFDSVILYSIHERFEGSKGNWEHTATLDEFKPAKGSGWTVLQAEMVTEVIADSKIKLLSWVIPDAV